MAVNTSDPVASEFTFDPDWPGLEVGSIIAYNGGIGTTNVPEHYGVESRFTGEEPGDGAAIVDTNGLIVGNYYFRETD